MTLALGASQILFILWLYLLNSIEILSLFFWGENFNTLIISDWHVYSFIVDQVKIFGLDLSFCLLQPVEWLYQILLFNFEIVSWKHLLNARPSLFKKLLQLKLDCAIVKITIEGQFINYFIENQSFYSL